MAKRKRYTPRQIQTLQQLSVRGHQTLGELGVGWRAMKWMQERGLAVPVRTPDEPADRWSITREGLDLVPKPTIWPEGLENGGYHDISCQCARHCGNCFDDLDQVRLLQLQMIVDRISGAPAKPLAKNARYCCVWCQHRAQRDRRLDRDLAAYRPEGAAAPS